MAQEKRQQLSKEQTPVQIREGQIKKFKLLNAGAIDPATNEVSYNSGATLSGITTVWDREKKELVIIKNITGVSIGKDRDGREITEEIVSPIEFDGSGMCYVNHKQPETYLFLSRDNRNQTNPFRDTSVPAMWYEVLDVNIKEKQQFQSNLKYEAMGIIKNGDIKDILAIGKVLTEKGLVKVNLSGNPSDIRWELEKACDINPTEVIRAGKEKLPKIKLDVQDAVNHGDIEFQPDGNTWVWTNILGEGKVIHKITPGYDPLEELAKHLLKEEEEMLKKPKSDRAETMAQRIKNTLKELQVEA